jgi:hypothetical protein
MNLTNTKSIANKGKRLSNRDAFYDAIQKCFSLTRCQILKLETLQQYYEEDDYAQNNLAAGNIDILKDNIAQIRNVDIPNYYSFSKRGVHVMRCHPIEFPLTPYMEYEIEAYKFNSLFYENIFLCNLFSVKEILATFALHDFMIFDTRAALILDIDDKEFRLQGGWLIEDINDILELQKLFMFIKSNSNSLETVLKNSSQFS